MDIHYGTGASRSLQPDINSLGEVLIGFGDRSWEFVAGWPATISPAPGISSPGRLLVVAGLGIGLCKHSTGGAAVAYYSASPELTLSTPCPDWSSVALIRIRGRWGFPSTPHRTPYRDKT